MRRLTVLNLERESLNNNLELIKNSLIIGGVIITNFTPAGIYEIKEIANALGLWSSDKISENVAFVTDAEIGKNSTWAFVELVPNGHGKIETGATPERRAELLSFYSL